MSVAFVGRDYSLVGPENEKAVAAGLASAKWYAPQIPRAELKALMERKDGPAIRDTLIWFAALIVTGGLGVYFWGSWAAVPFFIIYGAIYGGSSDSRWHECGHRTAFKTKWMNDALYEIACFMVMREPEIWRWSHTRHHTDTIIVGRDPEIITPRPPDVVSLLLNIFALKGGMAFFRKLFLHAGGRLDPEEQTYVPESERPKVYRKARIYLAIYAAVIVACVWSRSILPAMLIGLPSFYGALACAVFRRDPAPRPRRRRSRPPAQFAHRLHEPDLPVPLLEHELSRRASHFSPDPVSRAPRAAREDQVAVPDALSEHARRLS